MVYNYKSDEVIQDIIFKDYDTLINDISDEFYHLHRYDDITIYAPSSVAKEIVRRILDKIDGTFIHAESENYRLDNDDEVLVSICIDGMIFVENARWNDDNKLKSNEDCTLTYVYDSFTKKDIDALSESGDSILVFGFKDDEIEDIDDECDDSDDECSDELAEISDDDDLHGFSVSKSDDDGFVSYSFYTSESITKDDINDMLKRFGFRLKE